MQTRYFDLRDTKGQQKEIEDKIGAAAKILRDGGLVGIPTETVYGLGANALDGTAVKRIFEAKGRPQDNPLIIHVTGAQWLPRYCADVPPLAYVLARKFWPGPLTMILKRRPIIPDETTAGLDTVAVRCPNHPVTLAIIREAGIVGMGGATFPTYVKLKPGKPIDAVLINGSECEPYLTADHRVMLEFADDIVFGLRAMMKAVSAPEGVILIEDNKPDAIALMEEKVAPYDNIRVCAAKTQYPEGAEKMLIKKVMGRQVPSGKLPADVGCVVSNTSTAKAISDAIQKGLPLVERVVSVTGEFIRNPGNYIVKLGTNVQEIIDHCGGITGDDVVLKMGGPMMGAPIKDTNVPIIKGSNGIIAIAADHTEEKECIKCGRCMDVCPMELAPLDIYKYAQLGDAETLLKLNVMDCFSCKCCEYICSSKIPLVSKINAAKGLVMPLLKKK